MTSRRLMVEWAVLLLLAIAGASLLHAGPATDRIDNQLLDTATAFSRPAVDPDIVLVAIDDRSLREEGNWPWSRRTHARLIDRLTEAGARVVVLDVLLLEPGDDAADDTLAEAMRANGAVVLPHTFGPRPNTQFGEDAVMPIGKFTDAARGVGHAVVTTDPDGVLRRFDLAYMLDGASYPHLALVTMEAMGLPLAEDLRRAAPVIPFQPHSSFPQLSASSVIDGETPRGFLKNKIILVGATAQGMGDRYSVASGDVALMPGVEAQANLLNALMQDAVIAPVDRIWHDLLAAAILLVLFLAFWHLSPRYVLACALALIAGLVALSSALLAGAHMWLAPASIVAMIMLAYPLWSWRRLSHASRYLDREAARLTGVARERREISGLDYVTQQIEQLRGLVRTVHDSLGFLRRVIETAPDAIVVLDKSGRVQMLNARASDLFPDASDASSATFDDFVSASNAKLVRGGGELETGDGRAFLVARAELDADAAGGETGSIIALRDVTEARQRDDERRQMLEFLSHDMRNPQVAIVGLTRNLVKLDEPPDPAIIGRIRTQAERTLKLADDFVQLARLESPELRIEDADVGALVQEACDRAYILAETNRVAVVQDVPEDPCFAEVDPSLIARMLDNLIGNAIKYAGEGARVVASVVEDADTLVLTVSDNGPGLSDARRADPFARFGAHSGSSAAGPSSGLGLALVKKVIEAHRGTVTVETAPGAGTSFRIAIPVSRA